MPLPILGVICQQFPTAKSNYPSSLVAIVVLLIYFGLSAQPRMCTGEVERSTVNSQSPSGTIGSPEVTVQGMP